MVFLPPCTGSNRPLPESAFQSANVQISDYQRTECPSDSHRGLWGAMVALQFITFVGYAVHAGMAWAVWKGLKEHEKGIRSGQIVELVDEDEKRRREEEARKRWRDMQGDL